MNLELPLRYRDVTINQLHAGPLRSVVVDYLRSVKSFVRDGLAPVFIGRARTGKTTAAALVARELDACHQLSVAWVNAPTWAGQFDRRRFEETTELQVRQWAAVDFLVMDDFSEVQPGSVMGGVIRQLLAARFDAQRPTLWTGNILLGPGDPAQELYAEVSKRWSASFARRLQDGGERLTVVVR